MPRGAPRDHTSLRLNPAALPRLTQIAAAEDLPRSEVIRRLLRLGLEAYEKGPRPRWNR